MPVCRSIALALLVLCLTSLSACMKSPSVGFENATGDSIILRTSVDSWFDVGDCDTGKPKGAINRQGSYTLADGERLCLRAKPRKDNLPAGELISEMAVIRDARRCLTLRRDDIIDAIERSNGFNVVKITNELCPAADVAAAVQDPDDADADSIDDAQDED